MFWILVFLICLICKIEAYMPASPDKFCLLWPFSFVEQQGFSPATLQRVAASKIMQTQSVAALCQGYDVICGAECLSWEAGFFQMDRAPSGPRGSALILLLRISEPLPGRILWKYTAMHCVSACACVSFLTPSQFYTFFYLFSDILLPAFHFIYKWKKAFKL